MIARNLFEQWIPWAVGNYVAYDVCPLFGVGRGEARFAADPDVNGTLQGGTECFDVLAADGTRWEVKEHVGKRTEIRTGQNGCEGIIDFWVDAIIVCREILQLRAYVGPIDPAVDCFVDSFRRRIYRGELAKGTILGGTTACKFGLRQAVETLSPLAGLDGYLVHPFFSDPKLLEKTWASSARPDSVFAGVDGLVLVNPSGFFVIPKERISTYLSFSRISQGVARFFLVGSATESNGNIKRKRGDRGRWKAI